MNSTIEHAIQFYTGLGYSTSVSVGISSVLWIESKLSPGGQGKQSTETPGQLNPSGAYGIASWNGPRQEALADFASKKGLAVDQLDTQLLFIPTECANSYPSVWKAMHDLTLSCNDFIGIFVDEYEIPANKPKEVAAAITIANDYISVSIKPSPSTLVPSPSTLVPSPSTLVPSPSTLVPKASDHQKLAFILAFSDLLEVYGATFPNT